LPNWNRAVEISLEGRFHGGSLEENLARFENAVQSRPLGSGRTPGTRSWYGRGVYNQVRSKFYELEARNPSFDYSPAELQLLRAGRAPRAGFQLHHVEHIAKNPVRAVDPYNVVFTEAGQTGGLTKGTGHHTLHYSQGAKQLATATTKTPVTKPSANTPVAQAETAIAKVEAAEAPARIGEHTPHPPGLGKGAAVVGKVAAVAEPVMWYQFFRDYYKSQTRQQVDHGWTQRNMPWVPVPVAETMLKANVLKEGDYFVNNNFVVLGGPPDLWRIVDGKAELTGYRYDADEDAFVRRHSGPPLM
jgi:hypothetical protein